MAAPAVAGCTALLQEANATLKSWPEGCRAILLAAASKNITGNTWWADRNAGVDASDGSGAVDALEGVRIAQNRRTRGAAATRRGWDVGTLRSSDIGSSGETNFSYQLTVPRLLFNARAKVALAWDSAAFAIDLGFFQVGVDNLLIDLDVKVYDKKGGACWLQRLVGQQLRDRRVPGRARRDVHDQDPALVRHRRCLVRDRLDSAQGTTTAKSRAGTKPVKTTRLPR